MMWYSCWAPFLVFIGGALGAQRRKKQRTKKGPPAVVDDDFTGGTSTFFCVEVIVLSIDPIDSAPRVLSCVLLSLLGERIWNLCLQRLCVPVSR